MCKSLPYLCKSLTKIGLAHESRCIACDFHMTYIGLTHVMVSGKPSVGTNSSKPIWSARKRKEIWIAHCLGIRAYLEPTHHFTLLLGHKITVLVGVKQSVYVFAGANN